ncbi:hypothetical protein ABMA71_16360, partial [Halobacteriovorax sp. ZH3_bin.1]
MSKQVAYKPSMGDISYRDSVIKKALSVLLILSLIYNGYQTKKFDNLVRSIDDKIRAMRIVLTPAIHKQIIIEPGAELEIKYVKDFMLKLVNLNEVWDHETVEQRHNQLKELYYTEEMAIQLNTSVNSIRFYDKVERAKMASFFRIDFEKSKFEMCEKIGRVCGVVVGKRNMYMNFSQPYQSKTVAYFILGAIAVEN